MKGNPSEEDLRNMRSMSPKRQTHGIDRRRCTGRRATRPLSHRPEKRFGGLLSGIVKRLYECNADLNRLWRLTSETIDTLDRSDRVAYFNAKKFLAFQIAKLLDTLQNPLRRTYQSLGYSLSTQAAKGPYAMFDNVSAIFSATPVIARTATYVYACAEWVAEAFQGKEFLEQIYSRLLNPTSLSLANYIVDLEAGPYARDYLAWNFNSGMAAIDAALAHVLGQGDVLVTARSIYGGASSAHSRLVRQAGKSWRRRRDVRRINGGGIRRLLGRHPAAQCRSSRSAIAVGPTRLRLP